MTIETSVPQARAHIGAILPTLGDEEVLVADALLTRIAGGQRQYGRFNLASDGRDFTREAGEEGADACIYHGAALVRAALRGVGKPRSILPDVLPFTMPLPIPPLPTMPSIFDKPSPGFVIRAPHTPVSDSPHYFAGWEREGQQWRLDADAALVFATERGAAEELGKWTATSIRGMGLVEVVPVPAPPPPKPREWWVIKSGGGACPLREDYLVDIDRLSGESVWVGESDEKPRPRRFATRAAAVETFMQWPPTTRKIIRLRIVHVTARRKVAA